MENEHSLLAGYRDDLAQRASQDMLRRCRLIEPLPEAIEGDADSMRIYVDGRPAVNFSSNDYLGLARDKRLKEGAIAAIRQYGTGSTASRLICGTNPLFVQLEQAVANFKGTEAALVFSSGYQANVAILQALLEKDDRVFCDRLNHASLVDGCLLSGAHWTRYRHLDLAHLEVKLKKSQEESNLQKAQAAGRRWIVTDTVFSMDGDYPDLVALADLAERYGALVLVDEAHATGIYGDTRGSGLCEQQGVSQRVALQMGTFSKALGSSGAYVAGSKTLIDTLVNKARGFIYSTAPSPAVIGAALAAVEVVRTDTTARKRLWENIALFERLLTERGLHHRIPLPLTSAIVPVQIGNEIDTMRISARLLDAGHFVLGIRPPTVPPGTSRLRIALSAAHTPEQLTSLADALADILSATAATAVGPPAQEG